MDKAQDTPLATALRGNHRRVAELLLDSGAKLSNVQGISIPDWARGVKDTGIVLHQSAAEGELEEVLAALADGIPVDAVDGDGWTALIFASRRGHMRVIEVFCCFSFP